MTFGSLHFVENNKLLFVLQFHVCSWCTASSRCVQPASPACRVSLTSLLHCYLLKYYCDYSGANLCWVERI
jgi:hypothetical protein